MRAHKACQTSTIETFYNCFGHVLEKYVRWTRELQESNVSKTLQRCMMCDKLIECIEMNKLLKTK